jgi:hypothetical protein
MKRIKYAYSKSSEVYHVWASQRQESAYQSGPLRRASFSGDTCYSYNTAIGRLAKVNGHPVALINVERYSNTTRKHQNEVEYATNYRLKIFTGADFDVEAGLLHMQESLIEEIARGMATRIWYGALSDWFSNFYADLARFNRLVEKLGYRALALNPDEDTLNAVEENLNRAIAAANKKRTEKAAKREAEQAAQRIKAETDLLLWLAGGPAFTRMYLFTAPHRLRIKDGKLETTGGVSVDVKAAERALAMIDAGVNVVGKKIEGYEITAIDGDCVTIGCHKVSLTEARALLSKRAAA